ncbi:hypothetical protein, partial [Parasutterella excrementihominis]|uniref:hypothetical protein n=1 Tax=Parasutterella excrementihominis TaxID=487175 RepID=UPI003FF1219B
TSYDISDELNSLKTKICSLERKLVIKEKVKPVKRLLREGSRATALRPFFWLSFLKIPSQKVLIKSRRTSQSLLLTAFICS